MNKRQLKLTDYESFTEKFKPKKTTDDCYTPKPVMDAVVNYVNKNVSPLEGRNIMRPFWPGADYTTAKYPKGCIVIDNPPFSILSQILDFYRLNDIDFFLFCNGLTSTNLLHKRKDIAVHLIGESITFENGASVNCAFVTNIRPHKERIVLAGELSGAIYELREDKRKNIIKWVDNPQLVSAAKLQKYINRCRQTWIEEDYCFTCVNEGVFGGGVIVPLQWIEERERERERERKVSPDTLMAMQTINERYKSDKISKIR